jgi:hypothetical protein
MTPGIPVAIFEGRHESLVGRRFGFGKGESVRIGPFGRMSRKEFEVLMARYVNGTRRSGRVGSCGKPKDGGSESDVSMPGWRHFPWACFSANSNGIAVLLWLVVGPGIYLLWSNWPPRPDGEELMAAMNTLAEAGWFDYKREQAEQEQKSNEE